MNDDHTIQLRYAATVRLHYATRAGNETIYYCNECSAPFTEWTDDLANRALFPCDILTKYSLVGDVPRKDEPPL